MQKKITQQLLYILIFSIITSCNIRKIEDLPITFIVAADTHFDAPPESDQYYHVVAINSLYKNFRWPAIVNDSATHFTLSGKNLKDISGVVLCGDIIDKADSGAIELFKRRYTKVNIPRTIHYPTYIGLGNHDINPYSNNPTANIAGRNRMLKLMDEQITQYKQEQRIVNHDKNTRCYSWNWGKVHCIQLQNYAADTTLGRNGIEWLRDDLERFALNNIPVVIFQHYGIDSWATTWWNEESKTYFYNLIAKYNILAIFTGHTHTPLIIKDNKYYYLEANNAWKDRDGNGSFFVVTITNNSMDVINCRWKNDQGEIEISAPFLHLERTE